MLRDFIESNRSQILAQTGLRAASRGAPVAAEGTHWLAVFLDQLCEDLRRVSSQEAVDQAEIRESAGKYGRLLHDRGMNITQVVHAYGDFCQVITGLAVEKGVSINAGELKTLGICLDAAIAGAVTEHARQAESAIRDAGTELLGALVEQMHKRLSAFVSECELDHSGDAAPRTAIAESAGEGVVEADRKAERQTLFVVDRDPHVRRLVQQFVDDAYDVECFGDGHAALDRVRSSAPSALVTAILIPGLDGLALCRLLKGDPVTEHIPILVFSMLAADERARRAGANAFLRKPLEKKRFVASLRSLRVPRERRDAPQHQDRAAP